MPDILVVLPTYNEIDNLEGVLRRIRNQVPSANVLIVDDSSPDGTGELAERLRENDPKVTVLHRPARNGLGLAYRAGFQHAIDEGYEFVIEVDADGSHDPSALPAMIDLARGGADLVIGSRWVHGGDVRDWPWYRQAISRGGNLYSRVVLGSRVTDLTSGFRVFRTSVLGGMHLDSVSSRGYCFQVEMAWRLEKAGAAIVEHPITFVERSRGRSKMHAGIVAEALWRVTVWGISRRS